MAAVDTVPELAESAANKWGAEQSYTSVEEALSNPDIQFVDLCLPHHLHAPVAIQAAKGGKHVFVEKPIANTLDEADAMIAAAAANDVLLMVDQTKRYQNRFRRVKQLLEKGYAGKPILVKIAYPQDITYAWTHMSDQRRRTYWKHDGVISGIGIHAIDLLRWLIGEVVEVQAVASTTKLIAPDRKTEDSAIMILKFENGCIGECTVSYVLRDPKMAGSWDLMPLQIFGEDGSVQMDDDDQIRVYSHASTGGDEAVELLLPTKGPVGAPPPPNEGMAGAIDHLIECISGGATPLTDGNDARKSLAVIEAAYRSVNESRPVRVAS
ncbi:Gfo/Idh/MocA family oxidoreductase [Actinopolymorpha pittospori]